VSLPADHGVSAAGWLVGCDAFFLRDPWTPFISSFEVIEPKRVTAVVLSVSAIFHHGVEVKMKPGRNNETIGQNLQVNVADQRQTP